ncbi:MAG: hypothetical protein HDT23_07455 [Ruminococcus sp.]|nr:hypothetical protein [Ruminococcus sp.]
MSKKFKKALAFIATAAMAFSAISVLPYSTSGSIVASAAGDDGDNNNHTLTYEDNEDGTHTIKCNDEDCTDANHNRKEKHNWKTPDEDNKVYCSNCNAEDKRTALEKLEDAKQDLKDADDDKKTQLANLAEQETGELKEMQEALNNLKDASVASEAIAVLIQAIEDEEKNRVSFQKSVDMAKENLSKFENDVIAATATYNTSNNRLIALSELESLNVLSEEDKEELEILRDTVDNDGKIITKGSVTLNKEKMDAAIKTKEAAKSILSNAETRLSEYNSRIDEYKKEKERLEGLQEVANLEEDETYQDAITRLQNDITTLKNKIDQQRENLNSDDYLKVYQDAINAAQAAVDAEEKAVQAAADATIAGMSLDIDKSSLNMYLNVYIAGNPDNINVEDGTKKGANNDTPIAVTNTDGEIETKYCTVFQIPIKPQEYNYDFNITKGSKNALIKNIKLEDYVDAFKTYFGEDDKRTTLVTTMYDYCQAATAYLNSYKKVDTNAYDDAVDSDKTKENYRGSSIIITNNAKVEIRNYFAKDDTYVSDIVTAEYTLGKIKDAVVWQGKTLETYFEKLKAKSDAKEANDVATALIEYDKAAFEYKEANTTT